MQEAQGFARALRVHAGVVAFVGAGGKTTALYRCADELASQGQRVLVATTTRMYPPQPGQVDRLVFAAGPREAVDKLRQSLAIGARRLFLTPGIEEVKEETKVAPVHGDWPAQILAAGVVDVVLVEADGAAHRPLKAPRPGEPVYPSGLTRIVAVAGLNAIGAPAGDATLFRTPIALAVAGAAEGETIEPRHVAALLASPEGILARRPAAIPVTALLNQAETRAFANAGRAVGWELAAGGRGAAAGIDLVVVGSAREGRAVARVAVDAVPVAAIVLAAGSSSRLGRSKQLLEFGGEPLVRRAATLGLDAGLSPVVVVTGASAPEVAAALEGLPVQLVHNPDYARGQSTSLRTGVAALPADVPAAIVLLVDQPLLRVADLRRLLTRYRIGGAAAVVPIYGGARGSPVLFDRAAFPRLAAVQGDRGGRAILDEAGLAVAYVDMPRAEAARDIDTPADLAALGDAPARGQGGA